MLNPDEMILNGHSMYPAIKDQDVLAIEYFEQPKKLNEFQPGDVVFLRNEGEWVVHRVVEREGVLTTKGDWSLFYDTRSTVWGHVRAVNGIKGFQIKNPLLGRLSTQLCEKNRFKRRWGRLKILCYVQFKKLAGKLR